MDKDEKVACPQYSPLNRAQGQYLLGSTLALRSPGSLAKEFEPSAQTIQTWVKQADLDSGRRHDGLTTTECRIRRLRRQIKQLRTERDILAKAAAWFARQTDSMPTEPSKWRLFF